MTEKAARSICEVARVRARVCSGCAKGRFGFLLAAKGGELPEELHRGLARRFGVAERADVVCVVCEIRVSFGRESEEIPRRARGEFEDSSRRVGRELEESWKRVGRE